MNAFDTNLFYFNNDTETLFPAVNMELGKISELFKPNRLSLKIKISSHNLFHQSSTKGDLPLKLPDLKFFNSALNGFLKSHQNFSSNGK